MRKPSQYLLVLWEDPATEWEGWVDISSMAAKKPDLVYSIGWPCREDETHLYICMDWSEEKANAIGKIPKHAIKSRKRIRLRNFPTPENSGEEEKDG